MPVFQQQFTAVFEIAVRDVDKRLTEVRQREEQLLLHALPIAVGNFVDAALWIELIGKELSFVAELFREKRIDECDVVVDTPGLENLFTAKTQAEIPFTL
jgi:hypothetical protein